MQKVNIWQLKKSEEINPPLQIKKTKKSKAALKYQGTSRQPLYQDKKQSHTLISPGYMH